MTAPQPRASWLAALRARLDRPPLRPRVPLWWGASGIGSVEPAVTEALALPARLRPHAGGWQVAGPDLTESLAEIAQALRTLGLSHAWRDEQLAVTGDGGAVLGTVERGVVRVLGIPTRAVHLLGRSAGGAHWVQQRAFDKANDPGLWDTLVGGMVAGCDTVEASLARETREEAGLALAQLAGLACGGFVMTRRPTHEAGPGYVVERVDWYRCVVPEGVAPRNEDGEVAQFALWSPAEVCARLERDEFTLEAALLLAQAGL